MVIKNVRILVVFGLCVLGCSEPLFSATLAQPVKVASTTIARATDRVKALVKNHRGKIAVVGTTLAALAYGWYQNGAHIRSLQALDQQYPDPRNVFEIIPAFGTQCRDGGTIGVVMQTSEKLSNDGSNNGQFSPLNGNGAELAVVNWKKASATNAAFTPIPHAPCQVSKVVSHARGEGSVITVIVPVEPLPEGAVGVACYNNSTRQIMLNDVDSDFDAGRYSSFMSAFSTGQVQQAIQPSRLAFFYNFVNRLPLIGGR